ncbi:MAG: tol-pal system-associated acyl-CoA thioesterase [Herminiimonas sp.]|nr:tol-pal system-associated acyl-CoA thioesterase [Herminiimonas sp.]
MREAFAWPVRVYYEDTDTGGVVFYANYLKFFERARTEWLRSGGINQSLLADTHDVMFVVMSTAVDYHAPAKLDNELKLTVVVERLGRASVEFQQQAWRVDTGSADAAHGAIPILLATGRIKVACVDRHNMRPRAMPAQVLAFIKGCI